MSIGRQFSAAEAVPERQARVAVLSHPFWQRQFGGDAAVIGREITLNGGRWRSSVCCRRFDR
jgi:hypothetical protein